MPELPERVAANRVDLIGGGAEQRRVVRAARERRNLFDRRRHDGRLEVRLLLGEPELAAVIRAKCKQLANVHLGQHDEHHRVRGARGQVQHLHG